MRLVHALVGAQLAIYGVIAWLSPSFDFDASERERPLLLVLCLLTLNFGLHLWSLKLLLKFVDTPRLAGSIFLVALLARVILIGSTPIQEVDIYRYIWDGVVATRAISPFHHAPLAISAKEPVTIQGDIQELRSLVAHDAGIREVLRRVHFPELPTVYPPASQLVFAAAAFVTPADSSVTTRRWIMKSLIVAFDVASLGCIWWLLHQFGKHSAWLVAWGWSPLVLKEFANSGHLDSIAVFFTLAATCLLVMPRMRAGILASGTMMGLAVASKLYPVVLFPLWIGYCSKRWGWLKGSQLAIVSSVATAAFLSPMLWNPKTSHAGPVGPETTSHSTGSLHGLSTFLSRWEMNDLLFMIVEENIRPASHVPNQPAIWFAVVSEPVRHAITRQLATWSGQSEERIPFLATRAITAMVFGGLLLWQTFRTWHEPHQLPQWIFLTLAWFWFLSPTQNPWYWCWALAFVAFGNSQWWLAVSGLTMVYYTRFWFLYNASDSGVLETKYRGTGFFDFVVVWFEFAPFLAALAINSASKYPRRGLTLWRRVGLIGFLPRRRGSDPFSDTFQEMRSAAEN